MDPFWKRGSMCYYALGIEIRVGIFCGYNIHGKALVFPTYPKMFSVERITPGGCPDTVFGCTEHDVEDLYHSVWDLIEEMCSEFRGNLQGQLMKIPYSTPACINCEYCQPAKDETTPYLKCNLPNGPFPIKEHTLTCKKYKLRKDLKDKQEVPLE